MALGCGRGGGPDPEYRSFSFFLLLVVYLASILLRSRLLQDTHPCGFSYLEHQSNSSDIKYHRKQAMIDQSISSPNNSSPRSPDHDLANLNKTIHKYPGMASGNPPPTRQSPSQSNNEADMLHIMTNNLNTRSPYRRYPPLGVPCADGTSTFQLTLRREQWWRMLQEHAWKEKVMMQKFRLEEEAKERQRQENMREAEEQVEEKEDVEDGQKKQRKDSLVTEKDVASANTSEGVAAGKMPVVSAIYDSSEEEERSEDEEAPQPEQAKHVKGKKTSAGKDHKEKGRKTEHKARRVKPLGCIRTQGKKGSVSSCTSSRTSTSHSEVDVKEACQRG